MRQTWLKIIGTNDSGCQLCEEKITAVYISKKNIVVWLGDSPLKISFSLNGIGFGGDIPLDAETFSKVKKYFAKIA